MITWFDFFSCPNDRSQRNSVVLWKNERWPIIRNRNLVFYSQYTQISSSSYDNGPNVSCIMHSVCCVASYVYVLNFKEKSSLFKSLPKKRVFYCDQMWTIYVSLPQASCRGCFLSLLLAVLMIAVVAEMQSRWQSRAAAAAFPDLLSRQAALKSPDSLSFSLCETCEKFNLIWAVDLASTWWSWWRAPAI